MNDDASRQASRGFGVVLAAFGGPESPSEVEAFLEALFADRDCVRTPLPAAIQRALARRVARRRAPETASQYEAIGGKSPLNDVTHAQARALAAALTERLGAPVPVAVALRYHRPSAAEAVDELARRGVRRLVVVSHYPHYCIATAGSSFNDLARALAKSATPFERVDFVPAWFDHPDYIEALARRITTSLGALPPAARRHLLFSAHGLPVSYVRRGDPYPDQVRQTIRRVLQRVDLPPGVGISLSFQSRVGPTRWLGPATDAEIRRLGAEGVEALAVVPISFVGDHIETLYELDITYRELAARWGIEHWQRTAPLDDDPGLIRAWTDVAIEAAEHGVRRCPACLLPARWCPDPPWTCAHCGFEAPFFVRWTPETGPRDDDTRRTRAQG